MILIIVIECSVSQSRRRLKTVTLLHLQCIKGTSEPVAGKAMPLDEASIRQRLTNALCHQRCGCLQSIPEDAFFQCRRRMRSNLAVPDNR